MATEFLRTEDPLYFMTSHCLQAELLQLIKEAFMNVLMGIYHHRVEYPEDKAQQTTEADSKHDVDSTSDVDSKPAANTEHNAENPENTEPTKQ